MLNKCKLDEDAFERSPAEDQLDQVRACLFGIHQCFERISLTETNEDLCLSTDHLQVFYESIQIVLALAPELSLERVKLPQYFKKIAVKMLKAESLSTRLQCAFKEYVSCLLWLERVAPLSMCMEVCLLTHCEFYLCVCEWQCASEY